MHLRTTTAIAVLALSLSMAAQAEDDVKGMYVRGAFALGFPSVDIGDWCTQYGVSGALGYQYDSLWASDVEFSWTGGGDVAGTSLETSAPTPRRSRRARHRLGLSYRSSRECSHTCLTSDQVKTGSQDDVDPQ